MTGDFNGDYDYQYLAFALVLSIASLTVATGIFGIATAKYPQKTCLCLVRFRVNFVVFFLIPWMFRILYRLRYITHFGR